MFKWRSDKNRITAIFKLQFHATQVNQEGLVISIVPAENGKPTATLEKSTVKNNECYWENPIHIRVKFLQDPKTAKIQERIYYFLVSTGSPNGSLVGEFCVNIADYIAITKACSVSFPFKNSFSHSYLHVTIQRIEDNGNFSSVQRDLEGNEGLRIPQDNSLRRHFSNGDVEQGAQLNFVENQPLRKTASHSVGLTGKRRGSNGSEITLSSSDSSSGLNTPREAGVRNGDFNKDETLNGSDYQDQQKTHWDLAIVPVNDSSTEYSMNSPREFFPSLRSPLGSDDSVDKLRAELVAMSRRAEVSEMELQTLRKQIVKESKRGKDLMREISSLKGERNSFKDECEKLKAYRKRSEEMTVKNKFQIEGDPWTIIEVIREELNYAKETNKNLCLQLQKTQDSNEELILAVQDLEKMLEKNSKGASHLPNRSISGENSVEIEEEQKALEDIVKQHSDAQETYMLEQKIMDLCSEIEMYRRDKDELEMQMEQLALDYEILKQENHEFSTRLEQNHLQEQMKIQCHGSASYGAMREHKAQRGQGLKLENELKEKAEALSCCLAEMEELEACNKVLTEELRKQAEKFEADMKTIRSAQMEDQERAAQAESARYESNAIINELETLIAKSKKEHKKHLQELSSSLTAITELESQNQNLKEELEKQKQKYEADMEALVHEKVKHEQRASKAEEAVTISSATIKELEGKIKELENELKTHSEESSNKLASVRQLEAHILTLEEDLEKQAEGFEADLEVVTRAKVEQEQRAIRAEEALRLVKLNNANTAARIQDEFKRLSLQMQSSFEANEKLAGKALTEASGLRMHNRHLQDLLQKSQEDLQSTKDEYETKLHDLYHQISTMSSRIKQMEVEITEKSKQVGMNRKQIDESQRIITDDQFDQRPEIDRLALEKQMKAVTKEKDLLYQRESMMHDNSEKEMDANLVEKLNILRNLKNEKEYTVSKLKSEMEDLTVQCENLKNSLYEDELEKDNLRNKVFQLKADLKMKEEAILSIEEKFKGNSGELIIGQEKAKSRSEHSLKDFGSNEVATLNERVQWLQEKVEVGTQVVCDAECITSVGDMPKEAIISDENSNMELKSCVETDSQPKPFDIDSGHQQKIDVLLKEMNLLKEKNNSMEKELIEMQEGYSEISLKFAQVEGERQQLIMKVRNLQNTRQD